jgi:hypothetical protein
MNFAHYLKEAEEKLKKSDKLEGKKEFNPLKLEIGDLYEGGYFVGYVNDMTEHFALFVAPNETKESCFLHVINYYRRFNIRRFSSLGVEKLYQRRIWCY